MSSLYYRRWTRMYIQPAAKYFKTYDVLQPGMEQFLHIANKQNPYPQNKSFYKRTLINHEQQINNKLIKNLFIRYPDLKYQSVNRQKYHGDNFNSYSYSFAFITEQKKLMKAGYTMQKAFQIVQEKFQDKMKRKLDQTLISRGLAIGNRARSLLTIYQQQVQYESKLKMLRTKRQVAKYENQLKQIQQAIKKPVQTTNQGQNQQQKYERIFHKITQKTKQEVNKQFQNQKRPQLIQRMQKDFQNMFSQFYNIASYKDRLRGLTDQEIKQQIMTSPSKIKRLSAQLVKYLKSNGQLSVSGSGQIKMDENINQKLKQFIYSSPTIKIAILNHLIGYESPHFTVRKKMEFEAKKKLSALKGLNITQGDEETKKAIKQNKIRQMQLVIGKDFPDDSRAYRLLESAQERMLRLQIKYLSSFIKNQENVDDNLFKRMKDTVQKFRRLKFRLQKRFKKKVEGQIFFDEHFAFDRHPEILQDKNIEYEDLIQYLRKKTEQRRLKAIDQVDDNKINQLIQQQACQQTPKSQGTQKKSM